MNDLPPPCSLTQPVHDSCTNLETQATEKYQNSWISRALTRVTLKPDHAEILANIKFPCC
ncbi:hypothetical protein CLV74_11925 [Donghicola tyrosinivorans]|uniref:Uncharacterized protein n=1 Tax=Donghicola tyrosinivorans TaxID=1652492 RepID=A0A2T0WDZ0_9RHOB|nr:hypothetical protein CLV74_11925 [Donghicola tyrosinivorans]